MQPREEEILRILLQKLQTIFKIFKISLCLKWDLSTCKIIMFLKKHINVDGLPE